MRTLFATQFCYIPISLRKDKILINSYLLVHIRFKGQILIQQGWKDLLDNILRCELLVLVDDLSYLRKLIALTGKMTTDFPWLGLQQLSLVRAMTTDFPW